jgi:hypothetical protein
MEGGSLCSFARNPNIEDSGTLRCKPKVGDQTRGSHQYLEEPDSKKAAQNETGWCRSGLAGVSG